MNKLSPDGWALARQVKLVSAAVRGSSVRTLVNVGCDPDKAEIVTREVAFDSSVSVESLIHWTNTDAGLSIAGSREMVQEIRVTAPAYKGPSGRMMFIDGVKTGEEE